MKLSVLERIGVLSILPKQGNAVTLKVLRELKEALSFNEGEITELKLTMGPNGSSWDSSKESPKEVDLGDVKLGLISDALKEQDQKGTLVEELLPVYERFVEKKGEA